jgi:nucleoside-diphosphate-sugar epimerase
MTFLLTGAAGFIGSAIAKSLLEQGHTVIGVDNLSIAKEDITRAAAWQNLKDYDEFIHVPSCGFPLCCLF